MNWDDYSGIARRELGCGKLLWIGDDCRPQLLDEMGDGGGGGLDLSSREVA